MRKNTSKATTNKVATRMATSGINGIMANMIREARGNRTQAQFATEIGVHTSTISNLEALNTKPSISIIKKICKGRPQNGARLNDFLTLFTRETERVDFIADLEKFVNKTDIGDITLTYGYVDYKNVDSNGKPVFTKSIYDINTDPDKYERVLINYKGRRPEFGLLQSIECDSLSAIVTDVWNGIRKM